MEDKKELALKSFSPKVMLENINSIRSMIQRIRQKEGGLWSVEDELTLYRAIQDIDLLVDIGDSLKVAYDALETKFNEVAGAALTLQNQNQSLKEIYEKMLQERNDRIQSLEALQDKDVPGPEPDPEANG